MQQASGRYPRWSSDRAWEWARGRAWVRGCNFVPSSAVNQLEMWQADTFDPDTIRRELGWAADLGMNAVRVFLHDVVHADDPQGLIRRLDAFLGIADARGIQTVPVLFDDCWYEGAVGGPQPFPVPGIHNSQWRQSPGKAIAGGFREQPRLKRYVQEIVDCFRADRRILFWDVYNEVGNFFLPILSQSVARRIPRLAAAFLRFRFGRQPTVPLLLAALDWARELAPEQPMTTATYFPHRALNQTLLEASDVVSFHNYERLASLTAEIFVLRNQGRPLFCTEYLARTRGSRVETHLPVFQRENIGCFNWGLVSGRTQTIFSWADSGRRAAPVWYHDLLYPDGSAYDPVEASLFKKLCQNG